MEENYLKSAIDAQASYYQAVGRCLHTLVCDIFRANGGLHGIQVDLDHKPYPTSSSTYVMRGVMVDVGCGWVGLDALPTGCYEDMGRLSLFIYTHFPAVVSVKGIGKVVWYRASFGL